MAKLKVLLPYIFGLVSLLISLGVVSRGEWIKAEELPSPTPSVTPLPRPEPFPGASRLARCQPLSQPKFFFYRPTLTANIPQHLVISGTVYASDLSPLPNALVEIWQTDDTQVNQPTLFTVSMRTDETGHYEFDLMKPTPSRQIYFHYRVTHRDNCPLVMHLHLLVEPQPRVAKHIFAQIKITGPVLGGPVDVVMSVPAAH
jgi:hypothetical protein